MPHLEDIRLEALLEAGYLVVLMVVALGLEQLARVTHRRVRNHDLGDVLVLGGGLVLVACRIRVCYWPSTRGMAAMWRSQSTN